MNWLDRCITESFLSTDKVWYKIKLGETKDGRKTEREVRYSNVCPPLLPSSHTHPARVTARSSWVLRTVLLFLLLFLFLLFLSLLVIIILLLFVLLLMHICPISWTILCWCLSWAVLVLLVLPMFTLSRWLVHETILLWQGTRVEAKCCQLSHRPWGRNISIILCMDELSASHTYIPVTFPE